jgi:hypothetical protein
MYILRFHSKPQHITCLRIKILVGRLAKWYYKEGGGLYLTEIDQKLYDYMNTQFCQKIKDKENNANFPEEELKIFRSIASTFRSSLLQSIGTREGSKYPSMYNELNIEFVGGRTEGKPPTRTIYSAKKDKVRVGIEMWEAVNNVVVRVQIRKIEGNRKMVEGDADIQIQTYPCKWRYEWDLSNFSFAGDTIIGGYLTIVTSGQYFAVKMFDIDSSTKSAI